MNTVRTMKKNKLLICSNQSYKENYKYIDNDAKKYLNQYYRLFTARSASIVVAAYEQ